MSVAVILLALLSSAFYGVAAVLQHYASEQAPPELSLNPKLLIELFRYPTWLFGNLFDITGFVFQFLALRFGALSLVEPILVSSMVFAIPAASVFRKKMPSLKDFSAAILTCIGLSIFLTVAHPHQSNKVPHLYGWLILTVIIATVVGILVALSLNKENRTKALILSGASGFALGYLAASIELVGHEIRHGYLHTLTTVGPYSLAVSGILVLLLIQSAYQLGEIRFTLPILTVVQPIVAMTIGIVMFHDRINIRGLSHMAPVVEVLGLIVMVIGVVYLSRQEDLNI